jgi:L-serine deaminase
MRTSGRAGRCVKAIGTATNMAAAAIDSQV